MISAPNNLCNKCLLPCCLPPAALWPGTENCPSPGSPPPHPIPGICKYQYILQLYFPCWGALKLCLQSKWPKVFTSPKWKLGCWGSHLLTLCEGLMPPHSARLNLHTLNLIHQLRASGPTGQVRPWGGTNLTPSEKHGQRHDVHVSNRSPVLLIRLQSQKPFTR